MDNPIPVCMAFDIEKGGDRANCSPSEIGSVVLDKDGTILDSIHLIIKVDKKDTSARCMSEFWESGLPGRPEKGTFARLQQEAIPKDEAAVKLVRYMDKWMVPNRNLPLVTDNDAYDMGSIAMFIANYHPSKKRLPHWFNTDGTYRGGAIDICTFRFVPEYREQAKEVGKQFPNNHNPVSDALGIGMKFLLGLKLVEKHLGKSEVEKLLD